MDSPVLEEDHSLRELAPSERDAIAEIWLERARAESSNAAVFACVHQAARRLGAAPEVVALTARAAQDEVRHGQLCHALAELYSGRRSPCPVSPEAFEAAVFGDAPPDINAHLLLVYQSCINEGLAVAYLQENLRCVRAPAARKVIHQLLCDDLVHARIGWAHLASPTLSARVRRHVESALPTLLRLGRELWLEPGPGRDLDRPEHGCLGRFRHPRIVDAALEELLLPGFEHLGFRVRPI